MLPSVISFVDIETTGASVSKDRIIEIGIIKVKDDKIVSTYQTLINPQSHVPSFIEEMTGITSGELSSSPTFFEVREKILSMLSGSVFAAHNVRFDYAFLKHEFKRQLVPFSFRHFCTVRLSRYLYPRFRHHNLDSIIKRFSLSCSSRHRAFDDAHVLWQFYKHIKQTIPDETLSQAYDAITRQPSLPKGIRSQTVLPSSAGVYIFLGENGTPLYVGKSINIKERVYSHFNADYQTTKQMNMCQQITEVKTIQTPGELSALLLESNLIKKLQPIFNRQLRLQRKMISLKKSVTAHGYDTVETCELDSVSASELEGVMGICRSKKQAKEFLQKVSREYSLCPKLLGLEKSSSSCFFYRLSWCKGACIGKERSLSYNMRFVQAFSKHKIKPWPFGGAVAIEDKNTLLGLTQVFVIDKWCLQAVLKVDEYGGEKPSQFTYAFDYDVYKILSRYLSKGKNLHHVKPFYKTALLNI